MWDSLKTFLYVFSTFPLSQRWNYLSDGEQTTLKGFNIAQKQNVLDEHSKEFSLMPNSNLKTSRLQRHKSIK